MKILKEEQKKSEKEQKKEMLRIQAENAQKQD